MSVQYQLQYNICSIVIDEIHITSTKHNNRAGTVYLSGEPKFTPGFQRCSCYSIYSFMCMLCRSFFVLLSFFFWPLYCLSFFDVRILITSLWYLQTLLYFMCMFCISLFVLLHFFFWPLFCLSFDLQILITLWYIQTLLTNDVS